MSLSKSVPETTDYYEVADDSIFDIAVSGDGTWRKRGFKWGSCNAWNDITTNNDITNNKLSNYNIKLSVQMGVSTGPS